MAQKLKSESVPRKDNMPIDWFDEIYDKIVLADENEKLDFESKLLFIIMRRAVITCTDPVRRFDEFKNIYKDEIDATGRVFEWLGLVKLDTAAPLGWRSTIHLQHAIMLRGWYSEEVRKIPSREENRLIDALYDAALGEDVSEETEEFVKKQLVAFSLAQHNAEYYYIPTPNLKRLFWKAKARHTPKAREGGTLNRMT
jgi:hypothetical protein